MSTTMKKCIQVRVTRWPDEIEWKLEGGEIEVTHDDLSTRAGIIAVAKRAEKYGLGTREALVRYLDGIVGEGGILPMDTTGL